MFGQPTSYSEILQRVFYGNLVSGFICSIILAFASPAIQKFFNSIPTKADFGFLKDVTALYVIVPGIIGIISRMLKLHDRISDLFRIRFIFDTQCLLFPLAQEAGVKLTKGTKKEIAINRRDLMYKVFYPYAGFEKPVIDVQLVRTVADHWGWFWLLIESTFLFIITLFILVYVKAWDYFHGCMIAILFIFICMLIQWVDCQKSAQYQVKAILADANRKKTIKNYFNSL